MARVKVVRGEGAKQVEYLFRKPQLRDFWEINKRLPILELKDAGMRVKAAAETEGGTISIDDSLAMSKLIDEILIRCSIHPKFVAESPMTIPEGVAPIREMGQDELRAIWIELMRASGFKEMADGAPLSETEPDS